MKINFAKLFVLIAVSMFVGACDKIKSPSGPTDPPPDTKLEIVYDAPSIDVTDFVVEPQSDGSRNVRFRIRVDTGAGGLAKGEIGMVVVCYNNDPDSTFCNQPLAYTGNRRWPRFLQYREESSADLRGDQFLLRCFDQRQGG